MATRTEVTCDRCGKVWMTDKGVSSRTWDFGFWNLCAECDKEYLELRNKQDQETRLFFNQPIDINAVREAVKSAPPKRATASAIRKKT